MAGKRKGYVGKTRNALAKTTTVRVSRAVFNEINEMRKGRHGLSYDAFVDMLIANYKMIQDAEPIFVVGAKAFKDVAEARGQAIVESVESQVPVEWPEVCISIGKADPSLAE